MLPHAVRRVDLGGRDVTEYLGRLLVEERGCSPGTRRLCAREAKEQLCYVAADVREALSGATSGASSSVERTFTLPDGETLVAVGAERFRAPEALFQPRQVLGLR